MDPTDSTDLETAGQQVERFAVPATFSSADAKQRTIDCVWYTGAPVVRMDWRTGEEYNLTLDMAGCRLNRLNSRAAVLNNHGSCDMQNQVGVVLKAWADGPLGKASLQFSQNEDCTPLWENVRSGIFSNLSPGVAIHAKRDITPDGQKRREILATDWEPFEISLVPIPADAGTTFLSAEQLADEPRAVSPIKETPIMEATTQVTGETALVNETQLAAVRDEAIKNERVRVAEINRRATPFLEKLGNTFPQPYIDNGNTPDQFSAALLDGLAAIEQQHRPDSRQADSGRTVTIIEDATDKRRECMEAALFLRGTPNAPREVQEKGRDYAGMTLLEMARACLDAGGVKTRGMSRNDIARVALQGRFGASEYFDVGGAMTTSDFPNILANVANKTLRQAYEAAPRTFTPFCRQVSASDFKPVNRVQLSDIAALQQTNEAGEFVRIYLSDSKETYSLATWGGIVPITRKVVINDDLQALTRIPFGLGIAAATLESDTVWNVITANAAMADNVALFHSTHKNLSTSNGLAAVANITAARKLMRKQTAPKGTILNLIPKYLIVPAALEGIAVQLTNPVNLAATASSADIPAFVRVMVPIVEPRLDAVASVGDTNWYTAADPSTIDTIEYCYLEGQQGVYIETRQGFEVDGIEIKARLDFAAAAIDHRGLQKNTA